MTSEEHLHANGAETFGVLLRQWRTARKVSQLELALSMGVSQRHLSFLESGRGHPSRRMVLQLTEALDVPLRERNSLLHAAGYSPLFRQRDLASEEMRPVHDALDLMLSYQEPYPAIVVDRDWNMVMSNAAWPRLFSVVGGIDAFWRRTCGNGPRNIMRLTFHPDGLRGFLANWDEVAPLLLRRLQREAATNGSEVIQALLEEIYAEPGTPRRWRVPDIVQPLPPVLPLELRSGDLCMRLFTMISTFGTPQDITTDELRVETLFPADDETRTLLWALKEGATAAS